ncbi:hypothetical protein BC941DRAFT_360778 [Chlamydoabsidia padenii]|nr:hypothetical protein BC941DRAFT_360778 [Chlamydoabsidia padenii]
MLFHLLLELILPFCLYFVFRMFMRPLFALLLASVPAALIVALKGVHDHKVDMTGTLTLVGFITSGVLATLQADPKLYLLRESTMTLAMGIILIITVLPLRIGQHKLRPFIFYVARQMAISGSIADSRHIVQQHWDWFWDQWTTFRIFFRLLTAMWGIGLISEFLVRVVLLRSLDDVDDVFYYSNIYIFVILVLLGTLTVTSTLLLRYLYNREQDRIKNLEQLDEVERIIQASATENNNDGPIGTTLTAGSTSIT